MKNDAYIRELQEDLLHDTNAIYFNVTVGRIVCPVIAVSADGVFVILNKNADLSLKLNIDALIPALALTDDAWFWIVSDDSVLFYDSVNDSFVPVSDIYISFLNVYERVTSGNFVRRLHPNISIADTAADENLLMLEYGFIEHGPSIDETRLNLISDKIAACQNAGHISSKNRKVINGSTFVKKTNQFGMEAWYLINSSVDPDEHIKKCLFGGILGRHKYAEGRIFSGLLYTLTAGGIGILWLCDVIMMLFDNYRFKDGSIMDSPSKNMTLLKNVLIGFGLSAALLAAAYFGMHAVLEHMPQIIMK